MGGFKDRLLARILTRFGSLAQKAAEKVEPAVQAPASQEGAGAIPPPIPWTPFEGPLSEKSVAIVTTAGVHLKGDPPFDMADPDGDPSIRVIPSSTPSEALTITHDYYDHRDADRDINIVFPVDRLRELAQEGFIGSVAPTHYGLMGHITGRHVDTLTSETAPLVAAGLKADGVGAVLLTPG